MNVFRHSKRAPVPRSSSEFIPVPRTGSAFFEILPPSRRVRAEDRAFVSKQSSSKIRSNRISFYESWLFLKFDSTGIPRFQDFGHSELRGESTITWISLNFLCTYFEAHRWILSARVDFQSFIRIHCIFSQLWPMEMILAKSEANGSVLREVCAHRRYRLLRSTSTSKGGLSLNYVGYFFGIFDTPPPLQRFCDGSFNMKTCLFLVFLPLFAHFSTKQLEILCALSSSMYERGPVSKS